MAQPGLDPFYLFVAWIVALVLMAAMAIVDDRILQHVCKREGRRYTPFWFFSSYWYWRVFSFGWFKEAKNVGLLPAKASLFGLWVAFIVVCLTYRLWG